jgi:CheY-like chemotaxis protein
VPDRNSGPTALVVEDDREWLRILRDELLRAGFKIDWASDREEALLKVAEPLFDYDVVFLDPNLDDSLGGLSGQAVAERLGMRVPGAHVVLVSGFASPETLGGDYAGVSINLRGIFEKRSFDLSRFRSLLFELRGVDGPGEALFQCDRSALRRSWERVKTARHPDEKGKSLEDLAIELLSCIPLLQFAEKRARTRTAEIDAVFTVTATPGTLCQEWGGLLLVECRNREEKFDAGDVAKFAKMMAEGGARVGIVISLAGLTGDSGRDARARIGYEFLVDKRLIIALDEGDLETIISEGESLYDLLRERDRAVRLGK